MRLFIAVDLSETIKKEIIELEQKLMKGNPDVKLVEPENLHLTLKFLGNVGEDKISTIEKAILDIVKDLKPFKITLRGVGYFGKPSHVRTLWIGLKEGREKLARLMEDMNRTFSKIREENRKPSPHLTIGRVRSGRNKEVLLRQIDGFSDVKLGSLLVNKIKLKKSTLTPQGPVHEDMKIFVLEKNE